LKRAKVCAVRLSYQRRGTLWCCSVLSYALYKQIRHKAPTKRAFFEPKDHRFAATRTEYGAFASWLNFQKELFKFTQTRNFVIVTDIANYYDSISYFHLRNVVTINVEVDEAVLDMLIYTLSELLWQPDYSPRIEVGLPQIDLDAPRVLAHCFLFELDAFIGHDPNRDFVRFMDDIDVGVDTIVEAKRVLRDIDLVLQTKQIRLNSGKTLILNRDEAIRHFRVLENAEIDHLSEDITLRLNANESTEVQAGVVLNRIVPGLERKNFDGGNGEKILKRWFGLAVKLNVRIRSPVIEKLIRLRPGVRDTVLTYIRASPLFTPKYGYSPNTIPR
jgi:hypothetical protein